jgi:hypothetical protein
LTPHNVSRACRVSCSSFRALIISAIIFSFRSISRTGFSISKIRWLSSQYIKRFFAPNGVFRQYRGAPRKIMSFCVKKKLKKYVDKPIAVMVLSIQGS